MKSKTLVFKSYNGWTGCLPVDRSGRLTCKGRARSQAGGPVDRQRASALWKRPRSTDLVDGKEFCSSYPASVDRVVDRPESRFSLDPVLVDQAVDRWLNGQKLDRWLVDRPVDRKGKNAPACCQRANFIWGYKSVSYTHLTLPTIYSV